MNQWLAHVGVDLSGQAAQPGPRGDPFGRLAPELLSPRIVGLSCTTDPDRRAPRAFCPDPCMTRVHGLADAGEPEAVDHPLYRPHPVLDQRAVFVPDGDGGGQVTEADMVAAQGLQGNRPVWAALCVGA
jgi:hypothetical protein